MVFFSSSDYRRALNTIMYTDIAEVETSVRLKHQCEMSFINIYMNFKNSRLSYFCILRAVIYIIKKSLNEASS